MEVSAAIQTSSTSQRAERLGITVRRLLRRGARRKISKLLEEVRAEDVAVMLRAFTPGEQSGLFKILTDDFPQAASDVLIELEPETRRAILEQMSATQVAKMLELAAVDDAVSLLEELPSELQEQVLEIVDLEERFSEVQARLTYEDDTAGRIMDSEFVALEEETTASEAVAQVRKIARDVDMISYLYVVDANQRLIGVSTLRQLLLAEPDQTLGEIMNASMIKAHTSTDQEEVAQLAARYDLLAIPVVDGDGRLVGIVTIDDIIDVFKEEATEDIFKMAGTSEDELVYQDRSFKVAGIRLPWIIFNMFGLLLAGYVTTRFESAFDGMSLTLMFFFVPVIMGMAGNIGSQTSTIAVRGLATGRLGLGRGDVRHFLWQQVKVGAVLGVTCSVVVAVFAYFSGNNPMLAVAVGSSLFLSVQLASFTGVLVPVVFQRIGFDPAVASGPLVTTANDVLGVVIYFLLANLFFSVLTF
ncbi:MAG: magnesium transporter [bacterium]|nr:magnesium transporter [bacterium]